VFVNAIERIGQPAVPGIIKALSDQDRGVRARAITALGKIRDARAVIPLIRLLDDPDGGIVRSALWALGYHEDNRATDPLLRLWDKGEFRREIAMAFGLIGDKRAVQPIMTALDECIGEAKETGSWHQQDMTMLRYVEALKGLGDPRAIPLLKSLLEAGPQRTKVGAKYTLAEEAANALRSCGVQVEGDIDKGGYRIVAEP
jgi:HEAT repeat protein